MKKWVLSMITLITTITIVLTSAFSVSAIDNKYYITDLKMTVRLPEEYYVVTRDSDRDDEDLKALDLDYDETMTAFHAANIYLQAQNSERNIKISITMTKDQNSEAILTYDSLSDNDFNGIISDFQEDGIYSNGAVTKHSGFKCIDFSFERISESDGKTLYGNMVNTVINGMNLNFTIQKESQQLLPEEEKVLTNMVNNMSFDEVLRKDGPSFEWWRILLWIVIMAAVIFVIYIIYNKHAEAKKKQQMLKRRRSSSLSEYPGFRGEADRKDNDKNEHTENESTAYSLDKDLGYRDYGEYLDRSSNDIDKFDIKVKEKNTRRGIEYFEDGGGKLAEDEDYFDNYFSEETEHRSVGVKAADAASTYTKIGVQKVGNFVKNVGNSIKGKSSNNRRK